MQTSLLSAAQKRKYAGEGFLYLPDLLTPREVTILRAAIYDLGKMGFNLQARQVGALTGKDPRFKQLAFNPKVCDLIGELVDWERIYLHSSKVNFNCAREGIAKTWHQDNVYWPEVPPNQLTMWIAIDDADETNGCMWVLPGSHRAGIVPHTKGATGWEVTDEMLPKLFPGLSPMQCPVRSGGAIVFHGNVLHKSEPNRSDRNRWALVLDFDKQHNEIIRVNKETNMMTQFDSFEVWRRTKS